MHVSVKKFWYEKTNLMIKRKNGIKIAKFKKWKKNFFLFNYFKLRKKWLFSIIKKC